MIEVSNRNDSLAILAKEGKITVSQPSVSITMASEGIARLEEYQTRNTQMVIRTPIVTQSLICVTVVKQ
jgi:hypothetical protein